MKSFIKNLKFIPAIMAVAAIYAGCTKGPEIKNYTYPAPEPTGIFPDSGYSGFAQVTITGSRFGDYKNAVKVFFGGIQADTIISCEDGRIVAKVPANAISGKVSLQVWTHTIDSVAGFRVMPNPVITSVNETAGVPGDEIVIAGAHFGSDPSKVSISFNGTPGTINAVEDSSVRVTVPNSFLPGKLTLSVNNFNITGPSFGLLVAIPSPIYALDFENNLIDKISGVAATYEKGSAADLTYEPGQRGLAAKFPGFNPTTWNSSGSVSIKPEAVFKQREFTVTCWVNWATGRDGYPDPIFEFGETRGNRICFLTRMGSGSNNWNNTQRKMVARYLLDNKLIDGVVQDNEEYVGATNLPSMLPMNTWKHVAFVFSYANKNMKIYIDGVEAGTKSFTKGIDPFLMTIKTARIGGYAYGSGSETAFAGLMDNFRIYDQVLTAEQIYTDSYKK